MLTRDSVPPTHPLAPLLCAPDDEACGRATQAWRVRAEHRLDELASERVRSDAAAFPDSTVAHLREACLTRARELPGPEQLQDWRSCIESTRGDRAAFPLGGLRAPDQGWLVLRGRRGHQAFCDEVRAYDLATGAAYVTQSCGTLVLGRSGAVDLRATDRGRRASTRTGTLAPASLRDAALMIFVASEVERGLATSDERLTIPAGIPTSWRLGSTLRGNMVGVERGQSSAQTSLAWSWIVAGDVRASGALTWPGSLEPGNDYAVELLRAAEDTLTDGHPPAPLPRGLRSTPARPR